MKLTKFAILSISALSILMNAVVVPILSSISAAFPLASPALIKLSLSLPALMSIFFSLFTGLLSRFIHKKILLAFGLILFSVGGIGAGFAGNIFNFLAFRALLGAGSGTIAPLASDFVALFYSGEERTRMIGYSNSSANMTGVIFPLLAASMATFNWRFAFSVYGLALIVLVLTMLFIPAKCIPLAANSAQKSGMSLSAAALTPVAAIFLLVLFFYSIPNNLSVFVEKEGIGSPSIAALAISVSTLASTVLNIFFARIYNKLKDWILPVGFFLCGLGIFTIAGIASIYTLILGEILIGICHGILFPYFPLKVIENTAPENTTVALALLSSAFSIGMFFSQFFYTAMNSLLNTTLIREEFMLAAILFGIVALISAIKRPKLKRFRYW